MKNDIELYHHGVKGMKWGVRRYQNKNGTLTVSGRKNRQISRSTTKPRKTRINRRTIAIAAVLTTSVTAAAVYKTNPKVVSDVLSKIGGTKIKDLSSKTINKGKKCIASAIKQSIEGTKEGVKEGLREAPKKAVKTVTTGATLLAMKRLLDSTVGKEESARIFQAANNKKVSSFWKVYGDDKTDDD